MCNECHLLLVMWKHWYLVVSKENIKKRQHSMLGCGIDYLIYLGQWETIFRADFIRIHVVYAHLPFLYFLGTITTFANQSK